MFTTALALSFRVKVLNAIFKLYTLAADVDYVPWGIVAMKQGHNP